MDASIGVLIDRLEDPDGDGDTGDSVLDDTLVLFTSDNGHTPQDGSPVADPRINARLRGAKRDLYDGGIRVPGLAYWNNTIDAGQTSRHLTSLEDFQATAAQLAGTEARVGVDGVSILPTLDPDGDWGPQRRRDFLVYETFKSSFFDVPDTSWTIIRGDQKLVKRADGVLELYDIVADPREENPLNPAANAGVVRELESLALAEGAERPDAYAVQMREWVGSDGGSVTDAANWVVTDQPGDAAPARPNETWSARLRNTGSADAASTLIDSITTLGFEVSGVDARQRLSVANGTTLTGRNEVRVGNGGDLELARRDCRVAAVGRRAAGRHPVRGRHGRLEPVYRRHDLARGATRGTTRRGSDAPKPRAASPSTPAARRATPTSPASSST